MHRPSRTAVLASFAAPIALAALVAGCVRAEPYVLSDYRYHQRGVVEVCFDEGQTPVAAATKLAEDVCKQYDRTAHLELRQRYQCNWATPTLALYYCQARPGETPAPLVPQKSPLRETQPGGQAGGQPGG